MEPDSEEIQREFDPVVRLHPYDPRPHEDRARRVLAFSTLGLVVAMILGALAVAAFTPDNWETFKEPFDKTFTPVIGFAGVALSYFFSREEK